MKSWKQFPKSEEVAKYVECYWFLEKEQHDQCFNYPKLNPDPSAHLIISDLDSAHEYIHGFSSQNVSGNHWVFPHLKSFTMNHSAPFKVVGIKFKIGALYSLNFNNFSSYLDTIKVADVSNLIGSSMFNQEELLSCGAEQQDKACNMLDDALIPWLLGCHEDKDSHLVRQILILLDDTAVTEIGNKLHRSQRTIERSFKKVVNLSMKQVQSMNRLEEVLNYLYLLLEDEIDWADVANKYGFSDQPHLIRYLKGSIGSTPTHYVQKRDLAIDIYGNFELS